MSRGEDGVESDGDIGDIEDVLEQLEQLEESITHPENQAALAQTRRRLASIPGRQRIRKYTTRDMVEASVGGIVFSLPLLVEDGVFEIAEWFAAFTLGPIPLFLLVNTVFIVGLAAGVLYATDFREVSISRPLFGIIPRRLLGILVISFVVAAVMMFMWGRLHEEDPTGVEQLGRITVIWAASALGACLGDILPGESKGSDINDLITDIGEDLRD